MACSVARLPPNGRAIAPHNRRRKNKEALYKFSKVFPEESSQSAIYSGVAAGLVSDFLSGSCQEGVVMAYGVTSAGKTFTMQGTAEKPGLVPQALEQIFRQLPGPASGDGGARIAVSAYEVRRGLPGRLWWLQRSGVVAGTATAVCRLQCV